MSKRCKALYAYSKQHTNEISFEAGDIIEDVVEHEDGWWSGMVHGQLGVFPYTYVELLPAEEYQNNNYDQGGGGYDNNDYNNDYNNYDQGGGGEGGGYDNNQGYEEELPEPPAEPHEINVRAVYDYVGKSSNELSIKKGDVFIVNEKDSEGKWWHGVFTEPSLRKGWFPAQYVEEIEPGTEHQQPPPQHQQPQQPSQPMVHHPQHPRIQGTKPLPPVQPRPQQPQQPQHHQAGYDNPHTPPVQPQPPHQIQLQPPQPEIKKDVPMKALKSEKAAKGVVGYVEVQVHGAQGLPGDTKTALVQIGVKEGDKGKLRKSFKTEVLKKDINPVWMEQFQVNIFDPEDSDLSIEVQDGKKSLGEITVPLRSTKRGPLETYGGLDKTYNLPVGTLHCIVSYRDVNAPSKPKNFKKDESITMSVTAAGFDLSKAGATWQQKFAEAGLEIASEETPSYTPPPPMGPKPVIPQLQQQQPQQPPKPAPQQPFQPQQPQPPQQQPQRPPKPAPQPPHLQQGFKPPPPQQPRPPVQPRPPQHPQQPPQQPQPPQRRPPPPAGPRPGGGGGQQQHPPQFSLATQHNPGPTVSPRLVSPPKFESAPRTTQTPLPVQGVGRGPAVNRGPPPLPARDDGYY